MQNNYYIIETYTKYTKTEKLHKIFFLCKYITYNKCIQ